MLPHSDPSHKLSASHADALFVARADVIESVVDGQTLLFDPASSAFFSLNPLGATLWQHSKQPTRLDQLVIEITARFPGAGANAASDAAAFVNALETAGLIVTASADDRSV